MIADKIIDKRSSYDTRFIQATCEDKEMLANYGINGNCIYNKMTNECMTHMPLLPRRNPSATIHREDSFLLI